MYYSMQVKGGPFKGLMINRLLVLIQFIVVPIYFFYYTWLWRNDLYANFTLIFSKIPKITVSDFWIQVLIWVGVPMFFSAPLMVLTVVRANKIANAYDLMGRALGRVRIDQKLFYGLNAFFVIVFIILPVFSPLMSIFGAGWLAWYIAKRVPFLKLKSLLFLLIFSILIALPLLFALAFYMEYIALFQTALNNWVSNVDFMYGIGLCLADSVAIGNFWLLIKEAGAQVNNESVPYNQILALKAVTFILLLVVFLTENSTGSFPIINGITIFATILSSTELGLRLIRPLGKSTDSKFGFVMVPIFTAANLINKYFPIRTIVIIVAATIFLSLFFISYHYAEDPELF